MANSSLSEVNQTVATNTSNKAYVLPFVLNSGRVTSNDLVWRIAGTNLTGTAIFIDSSPIDIQKKI